MVHEGYRCPHADDIVHVVTQNAASVRHLTIPFDLLSELGARAVIRSRTGDDPGCRAFGFLESLIVTSYRMTVPLRSARLRWGALDFLHRQCSKSLKQLSLVDREWKLHGRYWSSSLAIWHLDSLFIPPPSLQQSQRLSDDNNDDDGHNGLSLERLDAQVLDSYKQVPRLLERFHSTLVKARLGHTHHNVKKPLSLSDDDDDDKGNDPYARSDANCYCQVGLLPVTRPTAPNDYRVFSDVWRLSPTLTSLSVGTSFMVLYEADREYWHLPSRIISSSLVYLCLSEVTVTVFDNILADCPRLRSFFYCHLIERIDREAAATGVMSTATFLLEEKKPEIKVMSELRHLGGGGTYYMRIPTLLSNPLYSFPWLSHVSVRVFIVEEPQVTEYFRLVTTSLCHSLQSLVLHVLTPDGHVSHFTSSRQTHVGLDPCSTSSSSSSSSSVPATTTTETGRIRMAKLEHVKQMGMIDRRCLHVDKLVGLYEFPVLSKWEMPLRAATVSNLRYFLVHSLPSLSRLSIQNLVVTSDHVDDDDHEDNTGRYSTRVVEITVVDQPFVLFPPSLWIRLLQWFPCARRLVLVQSCIDLDDAQTVRSYFEQVRHCLVACPHVTWLSLEFNKGCSSHRFSKPLVMAEIERLWLNHSSLQSIHLPIQNILTGLTTPTLQIVKS